VPFEYLTPRLAPHLSERELDGEARDRISRCESFDFIDEPILAFLLRRALQTAEQAISKGLGAAC
jgi:hypothetical protein